MLHPARHLSAFSTSSYGILDTHTMGHPRLGQNWLADFLSCISVSPCSHLVCPYTSQCIYQESSGQGLLLTPALFLRELVSKSGFRQEVSISVTCSTLTSLAEQQVHQAGSDPHRRKRGDAHVSGEPAPVFCRGIEVLITGSGQWPLNQLPLIPLRQLPAGTGGSVSTRP